MNIFHSLKTLALALILSIGIGYAYAAWAPPSTSPTGGNAEAPINTGSATQLKAGGLGINGLLSVGSSLSAVPGPFVLKVFGKIGADEYCDRNGGNCTDPATLASGAGGGIYYTPGSDYCSGRAVVACTDQSGGSCGYPVWNGSAWKVNSTGPGAVYVLCRSSGGSMVFTAVGPMSFTVPAGVTSLKVTMAGGGGGGSGGNNSVSWGSGGGGGGGYYREVISVLPNEIINGSVGGGGAGGCYSSCNGDPGGNTTFGSLTATGGGGGQWGDFTSWAGGTGGSPGGQNGATQNVGSGGSAGAGQGTGGGAGSPGGLYGGGGGAGNESSSVPSAKGAQGWIKIEWD